MFLTDVSARSSSDEPARRSQDIEPVNRFFSESRWRFAKTYVETYPHEYTLASWTNQDDFWKAVLCIERWGVVEPFWGSRRKYLEIDGRKYWHMGHPSSDHAAERPTLINRAWVDVSNYRAEAAALGYGAPDLDRLAERWTVLLERARRGA